MTNQSSPYAAVIADLKRKREKIDLAIKALEELGGTMAPTEGDEIVRGAEENESHEGRFLGKSIPEATKLLLQSSKKPLTNAEIVEALEKGGLILSSGNKPNTVGSVLNRRARQTGDIVSPKRGQWGLKEWYPGRNFGTRKGGNGESPQEGSDSVNIESSAGEGQNQSGNESTEDDTV